MPCAWGICESSVLRCAGDEDGKEREGSVFLFLNSRRSVQTELSEAVCRKVCGDLDDDIGDGLTGGSNIEEVEASRESSGSVGGAGGRDLRLERGMLG